PGLLAPFPLHISRLRFSYEQYQRLQDERLGLLPRTPVPLAPPEERQEEAVPAGDAVTTATLNDQVLTDILAAVKRGNFHYAGVSATDPRDQVFLARLLRQHCPGVQVFVIAADRFLTLPQNS